MIFLAAIDFSLPLTSPVLIFSLILFVILFAPLLLNKLKIPYLIGLIIAGALIGPNGFNLLLRDSSVVLFGTVGLLYIMFLSGLEIDLAEFKKNSGRSLVFGLYTFLIPMCIGTVAGVYVLGLSLMSSVLLASMFASHTLITYPIVSKLGVVRNRAVTVAVGGTMITDTLALLVLAVVAGMATGELTNLFWIQLSVSMVVFGAVVLIGYPMLGRWFFKRFNDHVSQYIFVLAMVYLAAFMAEMAGVEAIIGAFLAGLGLNRLIPHTSSLLNRIQFVGNALFIPIFLIGVGMLIDYRAFFYDWEALKVGGVMVAVAMGAKYLAAWLTQKTFGYTTDERKVIFGLSNSQAAATLAAVLVGYNIILGSDPGGEPIRLLNDSILNGTILMILVTCTVSSFATQRGAQLLALVDAAQTDRSQEPSLCDERILIPVNNVETAEDLIHLSVALKSRHNHEGMFVLNVIKSNEGVGHGEKNARQMLEKAQIIGAATDVAFQQLMRYDQDVINGIKSVVREKTISDLILGLHHQKNISDSFLGGLTDGLLANSNATTFVYKPFQPLATAKRTLVFIPEYAEQEIGFVNWLTKIWNLGRNSGSTLVFFAAPETLAVIRHVHLRHPVEALFYEFTDWDDFLVLAKQIKKDDMLLIVMSRKGHVSYHRAMVRIPDYLNKYFQGHNYILIYPVQAGEWNSEPGVQNISSFEPLKANLQRIEQMARTISHLLSRR
ncbi:Kef-type K+ transport system membrane component KefB [Breznakibacter xylanolyticus]|uniref:Kef-type K+ transport system membrane component KefB n=1 Tax=Breznakibacter xylanolyticus TaxID=990 RepID=A0A2W7PAP2_9BACT|nr:cation:proton antiporter [Breznakibacter xylanolyticus]PZX20372.1 Kef-type K+ transport system membrane component KefB [Breznakibacter xylanolyticus]